MTLSCFDLQGKVALVSGGGTGIGRGIAEGLAEAGSNIIISSRRYDKCKNACNEIKEKTGVLTLPYRCDITKRDKISSLVDCARKEFGGIDILVNNAGISGSEEPVLNMSEENWDAVFNTNLKGVLALSQAVAKNMIDRGAGGKVINIASNASQVSYPNLSAYCASKAGCMHLTKVMALEFARYNIQVNMILPGYFYTPMTRGFLSSEVGKKLVKTNIPMRRFAEVEEIKGVAILLASKASSFMTGTAIQIDGGCVWR